MGNQTEEKGNQPEKKFRAGGLVATVWENKGKNEKSGEEYSYRTVSVNRSYKDKTTDEWKTTDSMKLNDLPKLALVAQQAYKYLVMKEEESQETL